MSLINRKPAPTPRPLAAPEPGSYVSALADHEQRQADAIAAIDAGLRRDVSAVDALLDARRALRPGLGAT